MKNINTLFLVIVCLFIGQSTLLVASEDLLAGITAALGQRGFAGGSSAAAVSVETTPQKGSEAPDDFNKGAKYYKKHKQRMLKTLEAGLQGYEAMKDEFCAELKGMTPLIGAVLAEDVETIRKIYALTGKDEINCADYFGRTPLHYACLRNNLNIVELLVQSGANLDSHGIDRLTPFMCAATVGGLPILQYLKKQGANVFCRDKEGLSALVAAYGQGNDNVCMWLIKECKLVLSEQDKKAMNEFKGTRTALKTVEKIQKELPSVSHPDFIPKIFACLDKEQEKNPDLLAQIAQIGNFCGLQPGTAEQPRKQTLQNKSGSGYSDVVADLATYLDKATEHNPDLLAQAHNAFRGSRSGFAKQPRKRRRIRRSALGGERKQPSADSAEQSVTNADGKKHLRFAVPASVESAIHNNEQEKVQKEAAYRPIVMSSLAARHYFVLYNDNGRDAVSDENRVMAIPDLPLDLCCDIFDLLKQ